MEFTQVLAACLALLVVSVTGRPPHANETAVNYETLPLPADHNDNYRLPNGINKISYDIAIKPDITNVGNAFTFNGEVIIKGELEEEMDKLTLHAGNNIRLINVHVKYEDGERVEVSSTKRDPAREFLHLQTQIESHRLFRITIGYTASITGETDGFYKTFYKVGNEEKLLLITQFEPTMARRAFPCFDEPAYKATFKLTIYAPQGYGALSNTALNEGDDDLGTTETVKYVFHETPRMSTYSFAFMLYQEDSYGPSPFKVTTSAGTHIISWSLKSDIDAWRTDYSMSISARAMELLEKFFEIEFKDMPKINQVVVPNFHLQGRANWALNDYRSDRFLVDVQTNTDFDRELTEEYIANELAHQWFGNLVTPEWWDDTWLSEGLDEYFQYWVVNQVHRDWRMSERFVVEQQKSALLADSYPQARPLNTHVDTPAEIAGKFSPFTQSKGASIIKMLSDIMGEDTLRDALRKFVESKNHESATVSDLGQILESFQDENDIPFNLNEFLQSWSSKAGCPLVNVIVDRNEKTATATQERFHFRMDTNKEIGRKEVIEEHKYYVPLSLRQHEKEIEYLQPDDTEPVIFTNVEAPVLVTPGYYRVNYDEDTWSTLVDEMKKAVKSNDPGVIPLDRAQLVDDSLNLARAGIRDYKDALVTVEYLSEETDIVPWTAALPGLYSLQRMMIAFENARDSEEKNEDSEFQSFMRYILNTVYVKLGTLNTGSHLEKLLRRQILHAACAAGHATCLNFAYTNFRNFLKPTGGIRLEPDLRDVILCFGIQKGTATQWNQLSDLLKTSEVESERAAFVSALGCSTDENTLKEYLSSSLKDEHFREYERPSVFAAVITNPKQKGVDVAIDALVENFDDILSAYGERALIKAITNLAEYSFDAAHAQKLRKIETENPVIRDALDQTANVVSGNNAWLQSAPAVLEALNDLFPPTEPEGRAE